METWKPAAGFESAFLVSDAGRVISLPRYVRDITGRQVLKPAREICQGRGTGYKSISYGGRSEALHRVIARTFIPNPDGLPVVNHIDGNKRNNAVANLEWCTYAENSQHAYRIGLSDGKRNAARAREIRQRRIDEKRQRIIDAARNADGTRDIAREIVYTLTGTP